jgi:hypothetical protein
MNFIDHVTARNDAIQKLNAFAKGNHEPSPFITPFEAYLGGPQIANRVIK